MSEFVKVPVASVLSPAELRVLNATLDIPKIKQVLAAGGFIAGGFALNLLRKGSIKRYLTDYQHCAPGDIDIFFSHKSRADDALSQLGAAFHLSPGGFAKEGTAYLSDDSPRGSSESFKIQLVDFPGMIFPSVEETLAQFDFVNCQVALVGTDLMYPREWHALEEKKVLKIANNKAPFMGSRVNKYLNHRGYNGLALESQEIFQDWLIKAATSEFEGFHGQHKAGIESAVKTLFANGLASKASLVLFLGKWQEARLSCHYSAGGTYKVDWARQAIEQACD